MRNEQDRLMLDIENRIKKTQELHQKQAEIREEMNSRNENKELDLEKKGEIKFSFNIAKKPTAPIIKHDKDGIEEIQEINIAPAKQTENITNNNTQPESTKEAAKPEEKKRKEPEASSTKSASTEPKKKKSSRKENWICPGIVVKIMNKNLQDGKFYKQKGMESSYK